MVNIEREYFDAFGVYMPQPFGISRPAVEEVVRAAIAKGEPIPAEYDWWADLPPDAVA